VKVGVCKCFGKYCLDPLLAERAHKPMRYGDLPKTINGGDLFEELSAKVGDGMKG
jgi:hypothetical protein